MFGIPDQDYGERLVAVIDAERELEPDALIENLRDRMASYKVPREYFFAQSLPREDSGKIKKRLVREQFLAKSLVPSDAAT